MPSQDALKPLRIDRCGLDKLKQAGVVLGPSGFEGKGREVFRREHPRRRALHINGHGLGQRFFGQGTGGRQKMISAMLTGKLFPMA